MITIKINEEDLLNMLLERVRYWTKDEEEIGLFEKMYDDYIFNGCFEGMNMDIQDIVDNDWVNYTSIIRPNDKDFKKLLKVYKKQGLGDCSDKEFDEYKISFIEAVDNENDPNMFLVRH